MNSDFILFLRLYFYLEESATYGGLKSLLAGICRTCRDRRPLVKKTCRKQFSAGQQRDVVLQKLWRAVVCLSQSHRAVLRPEQTEADELRRMREDSEGSNNQRTAEQQLRRWALELGAECRHLHLLVEHSGAQQSAHRYKSCPGLCGVKRGRYFAGNKTCLFFLMPRTVQQPLRLLHTWGH